jgi:hypothetical protein
VTLMRPIGEETLDPALQTINYLPQETHRVMLRSVICRASGADFGPANILGTDRGERLDAAEFSPTKIGQKSTVGLGKRAAFGDSLSAAGRRQPAFVFLAKH